MDNLDQYFSDAEENISNEYMSANGVNDWDDAFDFGGNEEEYYNTNGASAVDASASQPYIISLYNSSGGGTDLSNIEVGNAYSAIALTSGNISTTAGIKYFYGYHRCYLFRVAMANYYKTFCSWFNIFTI